MAFKSRLCTPHSPPFLNPIFQARMLVGHRTQHASACIEGILVCLMPENKCDSIAKTHSKIIQIMLSLPLPPHLRNPGLETRMLVGRVFTQATMLQHVFKAYSCALMLESKCDGVAHTPGIEIQALHFMLILHAFRKCIDLYLTAASSGPETQKTAPRCDVWACSAELCCGCTPRPPCGALVTAFMCAWWHIVALDASFQKMYRSVPYGSHMWTRDTDTAPRCDD